MGELHALVLMLMAPGCMIWFVKLIDLTPFYEHNKPGEHSFAPDIQPVVIFIQFSSLLQARDWFTAWWMSSPRLIHRLNNQRTPLRWIWKPNLKMPFYYTHHFYKKVGELHALLLMIMAQGCMTRFVKLIDLAAFDEYKLREHYFGHESWPGILFYTLFRSLF